MKPYFDELVYWQDLPDGACALHFSEQGWAMASACANGSESSDAQTLVFSLVSQFLTNQLAKDPDPSVQMHFDWLTEKGEAIGVLGFLKDTMQTLSQFCDKPAPELQTAIQLAIEDWVSMSYQAMAPRRH